MKVAVSGSKLLLLISVVLWACAIPATPAFGIKYKKKSEKPAEVPLPTVTPTTWTRPSSLSLTTIFSNQGALSLSVDGMGTDLSFGTIQALKPSGGTVERAYLAVATTGGFGRRLEDGDLRVEGHGVVWDNTIRNDVGSWNAVADVTPFVESKINAAPPGPVLIDIAENHSDLVDGVVLAVIFDDPGAAPDDFVALFFGAQAQKADSFTVALPRPVPSDLSDARYELGVGISYSLQSGGGAGQYTTIDVDGRRLTTSAGGPDDGSLTTGALLTVGGVDDSPENPSDPKATPLNLASDDELYDLRPFLAPGDTTIVVRTSSLSEENLFFASVFSSPSGSRRTVPVVAALPATSGGASSTTGSRVIALSTTSSRTAIGSPCEITATVTQDGVPVAGVPVELKVVSGPHAGAVSRVQTQDSGKATFAFKGKRSGRDLLVAILMDGETAVAGSNAMSYDWVEEIFDTSIDVSPGVCPNRIEIGGQGVVTVGLAGSESFVVDDVDITSLSLENAAPLKIQYRDVTGPAGPSECACSDEGGDGFRDIVLQFKLAEVLPDTAAVPDGASVKWTLSGSTKNGKQFRLSDCVVIAKTPAPPVNVQNDDVLTPVQTEVRLSPGDR